MYPVFCWIFTGFLTVGWTLAAMQLACADTGPDPIRPLPDTIGTVHVNGLDSFDSDSIRHDGPKQWRWLSVPNSRLVMNPSLITDRSTPLASDLDFNVGYYVGAQPYRMQRMATLRIMDSDQAQEMGEVWRSESRPAEDWTTGNSDWSFSGLEHAVDGDAGVITVTGEPDRWGDATWRIQPPIAAQSASIRIHVKEVGNAWALKFNSPVHDEDVFIQYDSQQAGTFTYDLGAYEGWRDQPYMDLKVFAIGTNSQVKFESIEVEMRTEDPDKGRASSVESAWYPYQLAFETEYKEHGASLSGMDYFYDENTIIRKMNLGIPDGQTLTARFQGSPYAEMWEYDPETGMLIFEADEYAYALCFVRATGDGYETLPIDHSVVSWQWRCDASLSVGENELLLIAAFATQAEGVETARTRALAPVETGDIEARYATRKADWDDYLASVPAPMEFGIDGVDSKGVTPDDHRRAYYAAWTFVIQNVLPPMPENNYYYPQSPTGKPSLWAHGASKAQASAAWESFFGQQFLAYIYPDTAWEAFMGIMMQVDEDGWLDGEVLPSRKAQTAWILYSMSGDRDRLEQVYPPISRYLRWREKNPRWIFKDHDDPNQRDTNFVDSLLLDLGYAIKIAEELDEDPTEWRDMTERVTQNYVEWFFPGNGAFPHQIYDVETGERHTGHPTWVCSGLYLHNLPDEEDEALLGLFYHLYDREADLAGLDFCKYPVASMTAYGLLERGLEEEAEGFIQSTLRDIIRVTRFSENYSVDPLRSWGVEDSLFGVGIAIDFTLMLNGMRIDRGVPEPWEPYIGAYTR